MMHIKIVKDRNIFLQKKLLKINSDGQTIQRVLLKHHLIVGSLLEDIETVNGENIQLLLSGMNMSQKAARMLQQMLL
jgi:hypothetical protein